MRTRREQAGLTQRQLAARAGVSVGAVRDIEQGRTAAPRPGSLARLAAVLDVGGRELESLVSAARRPAAEEDGRDDPAEQSAGGLVLAVLGPLAAWRDGVWLPLGPVRQRAVLALLALHQATGLSRAAIVDALWGEDPPPAAVGMVQRYVTRLRRLVWPEIGSSEGGPRAPGGALSWRAPGGALSWDGVAYRLATGAIRCDLADFSDLAGRARRAAAAGDARGACGSYEQALQLWRGEPVADLELLRDHPAVNDLRRERIAVVIEYGDAAGAAGMHGQAMGQLRALAAREPLDERVHARLMVALAATGQQAAALALYEDLRLRLDRELGVRPGRELAEAHVRVLRQEIPRATATATVAVAAPAADRAAGIPGPVTPRYSLPPDTAVFTGRDGELGRIAATVAGAAGRGGVVAINGMPGVGKTALAVHAAYLLRDQFPDRQLFIDLRAYTPGQDPLAPEAALAALLTAAGVDLRFLPEDLEGRVVMWRDRMAGQRALLVLDNAASSAQVTPLLPGGDTWLVLVSSRRHLADLPGAAVPVLLETLPPDRAREMFVRLAPRAAVGPAGPVAELAGLAGFLPLAISLLARVYNRHPSWSLADLAAETRARLLTLTAENDSVAAAFEVSWRHLAAGQQDFFRCLGLHPGTAVDAYAAAALAGIPPGEAARLLDALHGEGLLTEIGYRRYGMHDLIRRYAADRAAAGQAADRDRPVGRLLDYYQRSAAFAEALIARRDPGRSAPVPSPVPPPVPSSVPPLVPTAAPPAVLPDLPDSARALSWMRAERASLLACLDYASRAGQHARLIALTAAVGPLLRRDGPWTSAVALHTAAVSAARHLGDRPGLAAALDNLGLVRRLTGNFPGAAAALEEALGIFGDLGDRYGRAGALRNLGVVRYSTGDNSAAAAALEEALGIYGDLGYRYGRAGVLRDLGDVRRMSGDYPGAAAALEEALGIFSDLGDRPGRAGVLGYLGSIRRMSGDYPDAARLMEEALSIFGDLGDRPGRASVLLSLGATWQAAGDRPAAARALEDALGIYRDLGSRHGHAIALGYLGPVRRMSGDYPGAAQVLEEALAIFRELGDRGAQAEVQNEIGALHHDRGDLGRARDCHHQALDIAREIDGSWSEAHALAGLGRCALTAGDTAGATAALRQAREIFERIGAAEATGIAIELDALARTRPRALRE